VDAARFPIRFTGANRSMAALGMHRANAYVEVGADAVRVRMGWAFHLVVRRDAVRSATEDDGRVWGWGVHGWRGQWLVNGSASGLVRMELDPPGRARLLVVPVTVRVLRVAVEDPVGLVAALARERF
jgi:hypothetical protein